MPRKTRKQMVGKRRENERICEDECLLEQLEAELHREWEEMRRAEDGSPDEDEYEDDAGTDVELW